MKKSSNTLSNHDHYDTCSLPEPFFIGDHPALDFLNTIAAPQGTALEWLGGGKSFLDWLDKTQLLPTNFAPPNFWKNSEVEQIAKDAILLREWFRVLLLRLKKSEHQVLTDEDIAKLNRLLERARYQRVFKREVGGDVLIFEVSLQIENPKDLLVPVAESLVDLLVNGDLSLVRRCANSSCTLWFYDRTKGHRRRWCTQTICGNRAKVAAFRSRQSAVDR